jgi:hypothetical protein
VLEETRESRVTQCVCQADSSREQEKGNPRWTARWENGDWKPRGGEAGKLGGLRREFLALASGILD